MTNFKAFSQMIAATLFVFSGLLSEDLGAIGQDKDNWWQRAGPKQAGSEGVKRSPGDNRAYRYLRLDNGLKVLLISDPETDKSAASLNVNVGSFQNPSDREGLAHFLEHMLFLGTDHYPEAGAYQKFINEHGGQHNAYTAMEDTNYFFDIDAKYLFAGLKRFSRFFIGPRFDKAYVDRERHAVESEFRLKLKDDNRREWEVFSEQIEAGHPLAMFSVGDLGTLADRDDAPVRPDLIAFYRQYYTANNMNLVILAREPLGQLEVVVRGLFSGVPSVTTEDASLAKQARFKTRLPFKLNIQPLKDQRSLSLTFPMPSVQGHWRTKPGVYWGHVLGDESEGSLISQLKQAGLANGLSAGMAFDTDFGASFMVQVELTPEGVAKQEQVLEQLFAWLNLARNTGPEKWRFNELSELLQTQFRFAEKYAPASYAQRLSSALRKYPFQEALRGPYLLDDFDEQILAEFVAYLKPGNAMITLMAPEVTQTDRLSSRYATPYRVDQVASSKAHQWRIATDEGLSLALANPYLANAYPLSGKDGEGSKPLALDTALKATVWHYADQQFGSARGVFDARIAIPVLNSCRQEALADLYLALVRDSLGEETYQASLAGLSYSLYRWSNGLGLSVTGFVDRQPVLLASVLEALARPQWQQRDFERLRTTLVRSLRNSRKQWPIRQLFAQVGPLLKGGCEDEILAERLDTLKLEDMSSFHSQLFHRGHVRFYGGGALSAQQTLAMVGSTMTALKIGEVGDSALYENILALPETIQRHTIAVDHSDSGVLLYIQGDEDSLSERASMALISMALEAPFYTTMRTEKQLGYVVGAKTMHLNRVPGLSFYIQSPVSGVGPLQQIVGDYLVAFEATLAAMSEEEISGLKRALLANIEEQPQNIMQQVGRHQESLALGYEDFGFRDQLAEQIQGLDKTSLVKAYQRLLIDGSRRLWISTNEVMVLESNTTASGQPTSKEAVPDPSPIALIADKERLFSYSE